ncbi:MAG: hypothetical protein IT324_29230 [Anaerolineae bacterium]|nr:hypothetical protein [Anaerolineae bacterium]
MTRRSRSGQSIILVAFAFVALIAFVGIATDVALLFVRYSTLRRAVDAAAIAAAGQVRENANYMTLNAVAMQFIQSHGLNPDSVKVETCETDIDAIIKQNPGNRFPAGNADNGKNAYNYLAGINPTVPANQSPPSELCTKSPQKLVRVSAQIASPTAFLHIIGWQSVTLQTSSLSQTALLDVALVLDTSLSAAADTRTAQAIPVGTYPIVTNPDNSTNNREALRAFKDFTNPPPTTADINPAHPWGLGGSNNSANYGLKPATATGSEDPGSTTRAIRSECWYTPAENNPGVWSNYGYAGCCNDPSTQSDSVADTAARTSSYAAAAAADAAAGTQGANKTAGPNVWPNGGQPAFNIDPDWYVYDKDGLPESVIMTDGKNPYLKNADGTYRDAAAVVSSAPDGNYSDLICRPFKDVRDAARRFIKRLDFVRGDRVVLVTFNSLAEAVYPDGPYDVTKPTIPMMTDKPTAIRTLNMKVGVEKNPLPLQGSGCQSRPQLGYDIPPQYFGGVNPLNVANYWSQAQCPDTNMGGGIQQATAMLTSADWIRREAVWVMVLLSDGYPNRTPSMATTTNPRTGVGPVARDWLTDTAATPTDAQIIEYCAPVYDPSRDGPARPYGEMPQWCADPRYLTLWDTDIRAITETYVATYNAVHAGETGFIPLTAHQLPAWGIQQSSFGFCPWWTFCDLFSDIPYEIGSATGWHTDGVTYPRQTQCIENNPKGIWETARPANEGALPYCADTDPNSRHFCMDDAGNINLPTTGSTIKATSNYYCDPHYDADDYARDRADFAGLINYIDKPGGSGTPKKGNFIAMYSIFFRNANQDGSLNKLNDNILGVKMLRYLSDAGDNGIIDNHLQRWYRDTRDRGWPSASPAIPGGVANPPTGLNETQVQLPDPSYTTWPNPITGTSPKDKAVTGGGTATQGVPPTYDGSNNLWTQAPYNYPADEDPCAAYDYLYYKGGQKLPTDADNVQVGAEWKPDSYEWLAAQDCGQYFFADSPTKVNKAFQEIASRLFTRLSR